jgi:hypothetical protein
MGSSYSSIGVITLESRLASEMSAEVQVGGVL